MHQRAYLALRLCCSTCWSEEKCQTAGCSGLQDRGLDWCIQVGAWLRAEPVSRAARTYAHWPGWLRLPWEPKESAMAKGSSVIWPTVEAGCSGVPSR